MLWLDTELDTVWAWFESWCLPGMGCDEMVSIKDFWG